MESQQHIKIFLEVEKMKLFSIGETSKLNNIPIKTLRYYDDIGLLKPVQINESTGYRYYSYDQFAKIDKIKRFKKLNIPLKELEKALDSGSDPIYIRNFFNEEKERIKHEMHKLEILNISLNRLEDYYEYCKIVHMNKSIYTRQIEKRYYIAYDCNEGETVYEMDLGLRKITRKHFTNAISFLNPYGYILKGDALKNSQLSFEKSTVGVEFEEEHSKKYIIEMPKGNYICYSTKLLSNNYDITELSDYLKENNIQAKTVIAEEFKFLSNSPYIEANYEIQILIE